VPSRLGARTPVTLQVGLLLCRGEPGPFLRIDADRNDVELLADVEVEHLQRAGHSVEHLGAEHRALVIHHRQQHRAFAEVIPELDVLAVLVDARQIERHLLADPLIDADLAE
jgi:hypothetical protein